MLPSVNAMSCWQQLISPRYKVVSCLHQVNITQTTILRFWWAFVNWFNHSNGKGKHHGTLMETRPWNIWIARFISERFFTCRVGQMTSLFWWELHFLESDELKLKISHKLLIIVNYKRGPPYQYHALFCKLFWAFLRVAFSKIKITLCFFNHTSLAWKRKTFLNILSQSNRMLIQDKSPEKRHFYVIFRSPVSEFSSAGCISKYTLDWLKKDERSKVEPRLYGDFTISLIWLVFCRIKISSKIGILLHGFVSRFRVLSQW